MATGPSSPDPVVAPRRRAPVLRSEERERKVLLVRNEQDSARRAMLLKINDEEQSRAEEIARERKHFWEPIRDAALAALPSRPCGTAGTGVHLQLDAPLPGRLLHGEATAADVADIRRLTRSSIWLFSSSTFRVSFGHVDKLRSASSLFSLSCALNSLISVAPSSPFFVLVFLISRTPRSSATT